MCNFAEDDSEPEVEYWSENEDDLLSDIDPPPQPFNSSCIETVSSSSRTLSLWILHFLMFLQTSFRLSDIVMAHMLHFFSALFVVLGRFSQVGNEIAQCLPTSIYKARLLQNCPKFSRYVVCKKCHSIYNFADCIDGLSFCRRSKRCSYRRFPHHPYRSMREPCGALLLKTVQLANNCVHFYPNLTYCYLGLETSLQVLLEKPKFFTDCELWRSRKVSDGEMKDVYDARIWNEFLHYNGEPFLLEEGNLAFILNLDFFQPYKHVQYSLGAIYMSVLNLPRGIRYKQENTILVGLIPGPHEPEHDLNTFLEPLLQDLLKLWNGYELYVASSNCKKKIRGALLCVACDLPAGRKTCGFLSYTAHLGCSRCLKKFSGTVGSFDYSGFDRENWQMRNGADHAKTALDLTNITTKTALEKAESESGCRYSVLLKLPYFDAPRMLVVDPMHNLFLGSAKYFLKKILIRREFITEDQRALIQERVDSFIVPPSIGRIPSKIKSGFSSFTADQWKNWVLYYSIICLRDILDDDKLNCWRHFVLACRLLCSKTLTMEEAKLGDALLLYFCKRVERIFGRECITPNMHMHCHLYDCILDYGPLHGFWCYAFERYNGVLGAMPNNNRSIEVQLMKRFLQDNLILSVPLPQEFSEDFTPLFPSAQQSGSLADTLSTESPLDSKGWTLQSLEPSLHLPKYCTHHVLDSSQKECLTELYSRLHSVSQSDISINSVYFRYSSVEIYGKTIGSFNSRTATSSMVVIRCDSNLLTSHGSSLTSATGNISYRVARINFICKHVADVHGVPKSHILVSLSWFKCHPKTTNFGQSVSVWYHDIFELETLHNLIPIHFVHSRCVALIDKLDGESVLFASPCVDF